MADGTEERLAVIGEGGYFGELGPMLNLPRSASARALTPTVLTGCSVQQFRKLASKRELASPARRRAGRPAPAGSSDHPG